jgi:hypothetical protein
MRILEWQEMITNLVTVGVLHPAQNLSADNRTPSVTFAGMNVARLTALPAFRPGK